MNKKLKTKDQIVKIKVSEEDPESVELIAKSIVAVSDSFEKLLNSGLSERAIVLLLHDLIPGYCGVGIKHIEAILKYAPKLKSTYSTKIK